MEPMFLNPGGHPPSGRAFPAEAPSQLIHGYIEFPQMLGPAELEGCRD